MPDYMIVSKSSLEAARISHQTGGWIPPTVAEELLASAVEVPAPGEPAGVSMEAVNVAVRELVDSVREQTIAQFTTTTEGKPK